jgi:hypothetical protein
MKIDPQKIARMISEDPNEVVPSNHFDDTEDEYKAEPRSVLIDETNTPAVAIPYNNSAEAEAAFYNHPGVHSWAEQEGEEASAFGFISGSSHPEIWIEQEGSQGVWTNFSSADRASISGPWPESKVFGNGDPLFFPTANVESGTMVRGRGNQGP